jgi:hypothetical protein
VNLCGKFFVIFINYSLQGGGSNSLAPEGGLAYVDAYFVLFSNRDNPHSSSSIFYKKVLAFVGASREPIKMLFPRERFILSPEIAIYLWI